MWKIIIDCLVICNLTDPTNNIYALGTVDIYSYESNSPLSIRRINVHWIEKSYQILKQWSPFYFRILWWYSLPQKSKSHICLFHNKQKWVDAWELNGHHLFMLNSARKQKIRDISHGQMDIYPFCLKQVAKCTYSETI